MHPRSNSLRPSTVGEPSFSSPLISIVLPSAAADRDFVIRKRRWLVSRGYDTQKCPGEIRLQRVVCLAKMIGYAACTVLLSMISTRRGTGPERQTRRVRERDPRGNAARSLQLSGSILQR